MSGIIGNSNLRMEMWVQDGHIFLKTPETENTVTPKTLLQEIQKYLFIDFRASPLRTIKNREMNGDTCPYCGSTETIGHGSRTTQKEFQIRRSCNGCNRTFVAGKEPVHEKILNKKEGTKEKAAFLSLFGYNKQEIAERLNIGWSVVNTNLKELDFESINNDSIKTGKEPGLEIRVAPEFPIKDIFKEMLGKTYIWDFDGRVALKNKNISSSTTVFLFKNDMRAMLSLNETKINDCLRNIPTKKRKIILNYIEDKKDDMMGILPKTHIFTKVAEDAGEIDAALMESAVHRDENEDSDTGL